MLRLFSGTFGRARMAVSDAAQFMKGVAEWSDDANERTECEALYYDLLKINKRLARAQTLCQLREARLAVEDPEAWEEARRLGGVPLG